MNSICPWLPVENRWIPLFADVWFSRMDERQERRKLYQEWRGRMRDYLFGIAGTDGGVIGSGNYVASGALKVGV